MSKRICLSVVVVVMAAAPPAGMAGSAAAGSPPNRLDANRYVGNCFSPIASSISIDAIFVNPYDLAVVSLDDLRPLGQTGLAKPTIAVTLGGGLGVVGQERRFSSRRRTLHEPSVPMAADLQRSLRDAPTLPQLSTGPTSSRDRRRRQDYESHGQWGVAGRSSLPRARAPLD